MSELPLVDRSPNPQPNEDEAAFDLGGPLESIEPPDVGVGAGDRADEIVSPFDEGSLARGSEAESQTPPLRRGSPGPAIRRLQRDLAQTGHTVDVDDDFDVRTQAGVPEVERKLTYEVFDDETSEADVSEAVEFAQHADFEDLPDWDAAADVEPTSLETTSVERELESFAYSLAHLPNQVLSALRDGYGDIAVRLMVAAGVRDENRLSNIVFHFRHPELGGRSIRPEESALAAEWRSIRNNIVRPILRGPSDGPAPAPTGTRPVGPMSRPRILSTARMRDAWHDDACREDRMLGVRILGRRTPVNARTVEAWAALDQALQKNSYEAKRVWVFNCRNIAGTTSRSLHAYGLAVDIDPEWNPNRRTPDRRAVRFSSAGRQDGRLADVRAKLADTIFTPEQVAAVEAIRTVDDHQVFSWGGRWDTTKDTMHFQLSVTPDELARGLAK